MDLEHQRQIEALTAENARLMSLCREKDDLIGKLRETMQNNAA
jgi:hypothetical protein